MNIERNGTGTKKTVSIRFCAACHMVTAMKKNLRVLVTAGDTYEPVDEVRRLTHMATGRLGSLIADAFAEQGADVTFLCGERSMLPEREMEKTVTITGVMELQSAMQELLTDTAYDAVIHSMAVSDYTVRGLEDEEEVAAAIAKSILSDGPETDENKLRDIVLEALKKAAYTPSGKISSDLPSLLVFLDRAPKVIPLVKQLQPDAVLVGFKLLAGVSEQELLEAVAAQMQNSGSDFVLANDLSGIDGDTHGALLVGRDGILERPQTKQEIAACIVRHVTRHAAG